MTEKTTDATFATDVLNSSEPVVVDFWAEWCGPCRMIAPALDEISHEMEGKVKIVKLNVDENPAVAAQYGIRSIPTLLIFKNGQLASQKVGAASKTELSKWISTSLYRLVVATEKGASRPFFMDYCGGVRLRESASPAR